MPPRIRLRNPRTKPSCSSRRPELSLQCRCQYATSAAAVTPAPSIEQMTAPPKPLSRYEGPQPPSYKPPELRKSQLLRQYVSLLHATPLFLLFQHNSLKPAEWSAIRRELQSALRNLDEARAAEGRTAAPVGGNVKLQVVQTNIFEPAVRIAEYFRPENLPSETVDPHLTHSLSRAAYETASKHKGQHPLTPLLAGPLAILTFPTVSPPHVKAALSILSPRKPDFPAPTRRANPGYYDAPVQGGLQKLMLLGAKVEREVFDMDGTRWVGGIEGGIDGLRAQLVHLLQSIGGGVTSTLENAGRSLYFTMEGRKDMLEEGEKGTNEVKKEGGEGTKEDGA